MTERIILARVTQSRNGQRRITIPKDDQTLVRGDWVEIRKIELERRQES